MQSSSTPVLMAWDAFDPFHALGLKPAIATRPVDPAATDALASSIGPGTLDRHTPVWHPDNPMFWFGALLAVTFGLVAASTQIRIGPVRAAVGAGNP